MKKSLSILLAVTMLLCMLAGCGSNADKDPAPTNGSSQASGTESNANGSANEVVTLRMANSITSTEPMAIAINNFADRVWEKSNHTLKIETYFDSILGDDNEMIEAIVRGSNMIMMVDPAQISDYAPNYAIMTGPYLYDSVDEIEKLAFSEVGQELADEAYAGGLKILDNMCTYFGTRELITKTPVTGPADMVGLKVRTPSTALWVETLTAMGASTTSIPFADVYSSLSTGVCDAMENPLPTIYNAKFQEVCGYVSMTKHMLAVNGWAMNSGVWESLSPEHQALLSEEALNLAHEGSELVAAAEEEVIEAMKAEGVIFNDCDTDAFREACQVVYTKFPEWREGLYEDVLAVLNG